MCTGLVDSVLRPKILEQTGYFNVDFESNGFLFLPYLFLVISEKTFNLEKKHLLSKIFCSPCKSNWINGIIFQTMYISKIRT